MVNKGNYAFYNREPALQAMAEEVLEGLTRHPKRLSPKYFYDARGSALFEEITELDEYYLTRTEMGLFDTHASDIAEHIGDNVCLIEYGSGNSRKIRKLLEAVSPSAYVPVDISNEHLQENARALHADFPTLHVYPVCADFTKPVAVPAAVDGLTRVGFFPGSSIGNFNPEDAREFLIGVRETVGSGGALLIGVDRKKSVEILERAYNDARGVTAAFNLNALAHLNQRLDADFALDGFVHDARYNADEGCIQMFLRSTREQVVNVAGVAISFADGEMIHTENSYKYDTDEFIALAADASFALDSQWSDERGWFSLYLLRGV